MNTISPLFLERTEVKVRKIRADAETKRQERNKRARALRWKKTGVSDRTVA